MSTLALTLRAADGAPGAELVLAPATGGALTRFAVDGRDVLRPAAAAAIAAGDVRAMASYPLVPYSNRIAAATLRWAGRDHALARNFGDHPHSIHGVGWQRAWDVMHHDATAATLTMTHAPATLVEAAAWPFAFTATQRFALSRGDGQGVALTLALTIESRDARPFPFGLGWHPFFMRSAATTLAFNAGGVWHNDATQLPLTHTATPAAWDFARPRVPPALDNVYTGWHGRAVLDDRDAHRRVVLEADRACRFVVVYAPEGRGFVAVEPVTQMTDAFNRGARGDVDTGTRVLAPGAAFSCTMRIVVTPA
ncbi:MAG: aldose 1-epimerase [Proteobacteria bacterium]|nr:aldose 1-epimerase [Pseudomonadota bacterium]